jgi:hypothetical protein
VKALLPSLLLVATGCVSSWEKIDRAQLTDRSTLGDAAEQVLIDETIVKIVPGAMGADPVAEVTRHRRARILNPQVVRTKVAIGYRASLHPLVSFEARTVTPDGKERYFGRGDATDVMSNGNHVLYSDNRALVLDPPVGEPDTIFEWRAVLRYTDPNLFSFGQWFGGNHPVALARLTVTAPSGWKIAHLARRLDDDIAFEPLRTETNGIVTWRWERRDIAPIAVEPAGPDPDLTFPEVQVHLLEWPGRDGPRHGFRDPQDRATWVMELARDTATPSPELSAQVAKLVDGVSEERERAARLYGFVRDSVEYCAVEIGLGGWRPHLAGDVFHHRYGDCKDKANLLHSMLGVAGVKSRLVAIYHHKGYPRRFGLAGSGGNFNHMILSIDLPEGSVLADATSHTAPFGRLPAGDEDADALPIAPQGATLIRTASAPSSLSQFSTEIAIAPRPAGARASFNVTATGHYADQLRSLLRDTSKPGGVLAEVLPMHAPELEPSHFTVEGQTPTNNESAVKAWGDFATADPFAGSGSTRVLRLSDLLERQLPVLRAPSRQNPIVLGFRQRRLTKIRIPIPKGMAAPSLPSPKEIDTDFARYHLEWRIDGEQLEATRDLTIEARSVPAARYVEVTRFIDAVNNAEATALLLHGANP